MRARHVTLKQLTKLSVTNARFGIGKTRERTRKREREEEEEVAKLDRDGEKNRHLFGRPLRFYAERKRKL